MSDRFYLACRRADGKWGVVSRFKQQEEACVAFCTQPYGDGTGVDAKALLRVGDDGRPCLVEMEGEHTGWDSVRAAGDDSVVG